MTKFLFLVYEMPKPRIDTSKSSKITKSRTIHRCRENTCSKPQPVFVQHVCQCFPKPNTCCYLLNAMQRYRQQFPSANEIAASILAQTNTQDSSPGITATPKTLPGVIDFLQRASKTSGIIKSPLYRLKSYEINDFLLVLFCKQISQNFPVKPLFTPRFAKKQKS